MTVSATAIGTRRSICLLIREIPTSPTTSTNTKGIVAAKNTCQNRSKFYKNEEDPEQRLEEVLCAATSE